MDKKTQNEIIKIGKALIDDTIGDWEFPDDEDEVKQGIDDITTEMTSEAFESFAARHWGGIETELAAYIRTCLVQKRWATS